MTGIGENTLAQPVKPPLRKRRACLAKLVKNRLTLTGETRLFYCDPRRSDQKGACERNHVEIRKLLPKGAGIRFDRLVPADLALAMSHVNSEPRGALGFATPARAFRAMLGEDAAALLDAYGVGDVPLGDLDLTPGLIERARAERGDAPLA